MLPLWTSYANDFSPLDFTTSSIMNAAPQLSIAGPEAVESATSSPSVTRDSEARTGVLSSKRRAQNRSAQRDLRQRKLQHVQDLEDGIGLLHEKQSLLHTSNELLKLQLDNLKIENEVLHATIRPTPMLVDAPTSVDFSRSSRSYFGGSSMVPDGTFATMKERSGCSSPDSDSTASTQKAHVPIPRRAHKKSKTCDERRPLCLNCERHFTNLRTCDFDEGGHTLRPPTASTSPRAIGRLLPSRDPAAEPKRVLMPKAPTGQPAPTSGVPDSLTINAAWQLLQNDPQYSSDRVDVTRFCEGLREIASFDGTALVFERIRVLALVEESSQSPSVEEGR
ncbi:hypothetical protein LTR54_001217 [Friedmanniomyces endolithicus]|nr:hypothetical protein LTR54_001217 [Friedmanniomyces endolithicus]